MPEVDDLSGLQELAVETDARAARARQHAAGAREQARADAQHGDHFAATLHLREAYAHERAAVANAETAALYRQRIKRMRALRADPRT